MTFNIEKRQDCCPLCAQTQNMWLHHKTPGSQTSWLSFYVRILIFNTPPVKFFCPTNSVLEQRQWCQWPGNVFRHPDKKSVLSSSRMMNRTSCLEALKPPRHHKKELCFCHHRYLHLLFTHWVFSHWVASPPTFHASSLWSRTSWPARCVPGVETVPQEEEPVVH